MLLHLGSQFSSDEISDGPNISITSANVTSLRKNWDIVASLNSSIFCLQETTLNRHGQNSMAKKLSNTQYNVLFGRPSDFKFSGSQKNISLWNARSGGLATISKKPLPIHEIQSSEYHLPPADAHRPGAQVDVDGEDFTSLIFMAMLVLQS